MLEHAFRHEVINAVRSARAAMPNAQVHLLYTPESHDPLELLQDERRDSGVIRAVREGWSRPDELPRMVTLDCRIVAPYLLETDPALDDPLFEASISLAYREMNSLQPPVSEMSSDGSAVRVSCVYGWIVTTENAKKCAARTGSIAAPIGHIGVLHPMRWYQPDVLYGLWPDLDDSQRSGLLGDAIWLMCSVPPALQRYAASPHPRTGASVTPTTSSPQLLRADQWQLIFNSTVVNALAVKWHALCEANNWHFPADAIHQLHQHVQAAQAYNFDADNLTIYVMTAVQLAPGAMQSEEAHMLLTASANAGIPLRDALEDLPDSFWERYGRAPA